MIAHVELEGLEKVEVNRSGSQIKTDWLDEKGKVECTTTIQLPKGAKQSQVSDKSAEALGMAAMNANDANIELSSISRNARQQAAAMFENAEVPGVGVAGLYNDYGSAGERVADVYALGKTIQTVSQLFGGEGVSNSQIIDAMEGEVNRQGLRNVTNHAADPSVLQVFDIRPSSVEDKPAMMRSIESMTGKGRTFEKKIFPSAGSSERGYHVEVLQSKPK